MSSLYLDHFGLNKPPFQITPDLGFFFAGGRRGDILSALLHVAQHEEGIMTLVAEVGSGKTLLARLMISKLAADICTIYLANPSFSRDEILGAIARDLGLSNLPVSTEARLATLQNELLRRHAAGQRVLLVIDEAHAMPLDSLEEVRLLSNLETEQHKLLNIMLFGQPELDETLADRRMRQVRDRVIHRFQLTPLPADEAAAYVDHRLRAAGWSGGALFAPAAMALLIKSSGGRSRRINLLADKALLGAYAGGKSTVQVEQVRNAVAELHDNIASPSRWRLPSWPWAVVSLALVLGMWLAVALGQRSAKATAAAALTTTGMQQAATAVIPAPPPSPAAQLAASAPVLTAVTAPVLAVQPNLPASASASATATVRAKDLPPWMATVLPYLERTQNQLQIAELTGYTLQIAALPQEAPVATYLQTVAQQIGQAQIYAQLSHYNGKEFVSVFVGSYPSIAKANAARNDLPEALKANKPIVRTWIKIRQDQLS